MADDTTPPPAAPEGLAKGGHDLWVEITTAYTPLDAAQLVQLTEACRAKDRLDKLDAILRLDAEGWVDLVEKKGVAQLEVKVDDALAKANATANLLKQLLASLRLPDAATGKRPQKRGGARGAYDTAGRSERQRASVTPIDPLERARQRAAGA